MVRKCASPRLSTECFSVSGMPVTLRSRYSIRSGQASVAQPHGERVLQCPFFSVERAFIYPGEYRVWTSDQTSFQYHFLAQGELKIEDQVLKKGTSWLAPANAESYNLEPLGDGAEAAGHAGDARADAECQRFV